MNKSLHEALRMSEELRAALAEGKPVVALESTVISHGLPYPQNLALAREMEQIVRDGGATPATIALAEGQLQIGLDDSLLERLATEAHVAKISLRNLGLVLADRALGATTVAATMWAAQAAGIAIFATGGIGGVHPGDGMDISADLPALATIPVCVVSSGAKAILDLPRTCEWLESWGVPLLGWQSDEMPAFYSRTSGRYVDRRVEDATAAARLIDAHLALGRSGILLAVPPPPETALEATQMQRWVQAAQREARARNVSGSELTPFLLGELATRSEGRTLQSNLALLKNNARVAAQVATALAFKRSAHERANARS